MEPVYKGISDYPKHSRIHLGSLFPLPHPNSLGLFWTFYLEPHPSVFEKHGNRLFKYSSRILLFLSVSHKEWSMSLWTSEGNRREFFKQNQKVVQWGEFLLEWIASRNLTGAQAKLENPSKHTLLSLRFLRGKTSFCEMTLNRNNILSGRFSFLKIQHNCVQTSALSCSSSVTVAIAFGTQYWVVCFLCGWVRSESTSHARRHSPIRGHALCSALHTPLLYSPISPPPPPHLKSWKLGDILELLGAVQGCFRFQSRICFSEKHHNPF